MRLLGLDIGKARTGLAVSDSGGTVASPLSVIETKQLLSDVSAAKRIVVDYEVGALVVGLPLSLDGSEGPQAEEVRRVAGRLGRQLGLPVHFTDERLSTSEAQRAMAEAGVAIAKRRGAVDMMAATIILQTYLDKARKEKDSSE